MIEIWRSMLMSAFLNVCFEAVLAEKDASQWYVDPRFCYVYQNLISSFNYTLLLLFLKLWSEVAQSCPTLCDPMDCSLQGSSVHEIFQARLLEWVAISFSSRSSQPRDRTQVSHIAGRRFIIWATREVP